MSLHTADAVSIEAGQEQFEDGGVQRTVEAEAGGSAVTPDDGGAERLEAGETRDEVIVHAEARSAGKLAAAGRDVTQAHAEVGAAQPAQQDRGARDRPRGGASRGRLGILRVAAPAATELGKGR